jgi:hypothetical protein
MFQFIRYIVTKADIAYDQKVVAFGGAMSICSISRVSSYACLVDDSDPSTTTP